MLYDLLKQNVEIVEASLTDSYGNPVFSRYEKLYQINANIGSGDVVLIYLENHDSESKYNGEYVFVFNKEESVIGRDCDFLPPTYDECLYSLSEEFCIELKYTEEENFFIKMITTTPYGCRNFECGRLNGLFSIIYDFLSSINFYGKIYLNDDAKAGDNFLIFSRLLEGKEDVSIYGKYGFKIVSKEVETIIDTYKETKDDQVLNMLKNKTRNLLMVADSYEKFKKC